MLELLKCYFVGVQTMVKSLANAVAVRAAKAERKLVKAEAKLVKCEAKLVRRKAKVEAARQVHQAALAEAERLGVCAGDSLTR